MRKLVNELIFGKNTLLSGVMALAVVATMVLGCNCGKNFDLSNLAKESNSGTPSNTSKGDPKDTTDTTAPSEAVVEGLVKDTMSQFADAVSSGDFSDLHSNASEDFQSTYTVSEMKTAFKAYLDKKSVVLPILKKIDSTDTIFTSDPSIRKEKGLNILMATGKFPTKPFNVRFDFEYVMRGGEWKLLKLIINIP
ncbi:hypothetical protein BH10ACI3_BH10ACI3_12380 [soil metagenome]